MIQGNGLKHQRQIVREKSKRGRQIIHLCLVTMGMFMRLENTNDASTPSRCCETADSLSAVFFVHGCVAGVFNAGAQREVYYDGYDVV